ncbi:hypothetical protein OAH06_02645, partial [Akkermansiaceae bacterium]|nr:hypothetical protein [Akkermansiaceae bacterium]
KALIVIGAFTFPFVVDSTIHFYRDIAICFFCTLYFYRAKTPLEKVGFFLPAILLRTSSIIIPILIFVASKIRKSRHPVMGLFFATTAFFLIQNNKEIVGKALQVTISYTSDIGRIGQRSQAFAGIAGMDLVENRKKAAYKNEDRKNRDFGYIYEDGLQNYLTRATLIYLNPVELRLLDREIFSKQKGISFGKDFYSLLVVNTLICMKVISLPIFVMGFFIVFRKRPEYCFALVFYTLSIILVSFQSRHLVSLGFVYFYFLAIGIESYGDNNSYPKALKAIGLVVFLALVLLNLV